MNNIISVNELQYLFKNIMRINYFIKRKELNITKSRFYTTKSALIQYVIQAVKNNYYEDLPVSYEILEIQEQTNGISSKLVSFKFNIDDTIYMCHQVLDKKLMKIIGDDIKDITECSVYSPENDENWPDNLGDVHDLNIVWNNILMHLHNSSWKVFCFVNAITWVARIESIYPNIKIMGSAKKSRWNNETLVNIRLSKKPGYSTGVFHIKYIRENLNALLSFPMNSNLISMAK